MFYSLLCIGIMAVIIIILLIKIYLLKKSAREISQEFSRILQADTNTVISISSLDKDLRKLADSINKQLKILRRAHCRYTQGDTELKTAITNISHDLRTPLTAICGYLDIMKPMQKPENIEKYLSVIADRTEMMKQLTEELFRYSVIISEDNAKEMEQIFVNQVLAESIAGFYPALKKKGIEPEIHICGERIIRNLNPSSLSRVFSNLINNAVKYSDGDLKITLDSFGKVTFANTAVSLTSVQVEQLFNRFYTVETAGNSTGLGLAIAKTLAEQMGGGIAAEYHENTLYIILDLQ